MSSGPRVRVKDGVVLRPGHFRPEIAIILRIVSEEAPMSEVWITEGWREGSGLHPLDRAFDFRVFNCPPDLVEPWRQKVAQRLGSDYDVVVHGPVRHMHVEYDP